MPDGQLKLEDEAFALSASVGVLVEPVKGTRFGLTYYPQLEYNFEDTHGLFF